MKRFPSLSKGEADNPISQGKTGFRSGWPMWMKQMPRFRNFPDPNESFQLLDNGQIEEMMTNHEPQAAERMRVDIKHMEYELLRLFRSVDYEAKRQQNRYRFYQIIYMLLAFVATLIGAMLALSLDSKPGLAPWLAFGETIVALVTTYVATISGREPALPAWLNNRRRAEALRREYFRYLMNMEPYDSVEGYHREMLLSRRAADINRGVFGETERKVG
jgi:hypothetical protein